MTPAVPCAEWGTSRWVRTHTQFHLQTCLAQRDMSLKWETVEVVEIKVPEPERPKENPWVALGHCVALIVIGFVITARFVSR